MSRDSIAALATPSGIGGVGIVRVSGSDCRRVARQVLGRLPPPRYATLATFRTADHRVIDQGIALYFPAPRSFTGEDVLELQGHGGPVVMDLLLQRVLECGVRVARPGEFSERAFLNGKLDLTQAEAIADLIESGTAEAARLASRSLQGAFSRRVRELADDLMGLRTYVEAAIDFPEEEIDFLSDQKVSAHLRRIIDQTTAVLKSARSGRLLRDGLHLVIAGRPNAGKSSLLNALSGRDAAIVTEIPGTTRDLLRERIQIDGIPLHLVDTAGLREDAEAIEAEGVRRAKAEIAQADHILWVFDDQADPQHLAFDRAYLPPGVRCTLVRNKIDCTGRPAGTTETPEGLEIAISAKYGDGVDELKAHLKRSAGYQGPQEGEFIARRRHLTALDCVSKHLHAGQAALQKGCAGELLAEDLRQAQHALGEITGEVTSEDLLGEIFSSFCIGK
jgi:tRNA modification GTPase